MAEDKIICTTNRIHYSTIRKSMEQGVRTTQKAIEIAGVCNDCVACKENLEGILTSVCGCKEVSLEDVLNATRNGADTVEKVGEITKAGTEEDCGKCKALIQNIIDLKR